MIGFRVVNKTIAVLLASAWLCLGMSVGAGAQTAGTVAPIPLKIGALRSEASAEVYFGIEAGIFKKAGLDAHIELFNNGAAISAAIAGGALDIGLADLVTALNAHLRGVPLIYLFPGSVSTEGNPEFNLITREDSGVKSGRDLDGATIAVGGLNNIAALSAMSWIDNSGGSSKSAHFIEVPPAAHRDVVQQRKVKGAIDPEPNATLAAADGMHVIPLGKFGIATAFLVNGWITTNDWIAHNPVAAARFTTAMHETAAWANANHAATAPMLARYAGIPEAVVQKMPRYLYAEDADANLIRPVIDTALRYGIISKTFDPLELMYRRPQTR